MACLACRTSDRVSGRVMRVFCVSEIFRGTLRKHSLWTESLCSIVVFCIQGSVIVVDVCANSDGVGEYASVSILRLKDRGSALTTMQFEEFLAASIPDPDPTAENWFSNSVDQSFFLLFVFVSQSLTTLTAWIAAATRLFLFWVEYFLIVCCQVCRRRVRLSGIFRRKRMSGLGVTLANNSFILRLFLTPASPRPKHRTFKEAREIGSIIEVNVLPGCARSHCHCEWMYRCVVLMFLKSPLG
ncbi:uncharacterized protein [Physcomitrium patens]|uniref:uncharacterized protein n=1 Tax=Physcomitrium patens TaxID=3218 RepID=UPI003CCE1A00